MRNFKFIIAMLVLAVFAVGAVSAAEDIAIEDNIIEPADDIVIEDVEADGVDEIASDVEEDITADDVDEESRTVPAISYTPYYITTSSNFADINANITNGIFDGYEFIFDNTTDYTNFAMVTGNNNKFTGNGATIIGSTDNLFTVAGSNNITITGFNMQVASGKAAIYGANVFNADITNNNISGGKDGINIMQTYDNVTISGNTITGVTRDAISLVDHRTLSDTAWDDRGNTIISNNVITGKSSYGTEYGMFIGGNFKGTISGNTITGVATGIEFAGKKNVTNGKLSADFNNNNITGVKYGMNMFHPDVTYFNLTNCNILLSYPYAISSNYGAINTNENFNATDYIGVYNSNFRGKISGDFKTAAGNNTANNTGF